MLLLPLLSVALSAPSVETVESLCRRLLLETHVRHTVPTELRRVLVTCADVPEALLASALACGLQARWQTTSGGRQLVPQVRQPLREQFQHGLRSLSDSGLSSALVAALMKVDVSPLSSLPRGRSVPLQLSKLGAEDLEAVTVWATKGLIPNAQRTSLVGCVTSGGVLVRAITTVLGQKHVEVRLTVPLLTGEPARTRTPVPFAVAWGDRVYEDPFGGLAGAVAAVSQAREGLSPLVPFFKDLAPPASLASPPYLCVWTPDLLGLCRSAKLHPLAVALASSDAQVAYDKTSVGGVAVLRPRSFWFAKDMPDWLTLERSISVLGKRYSLDESSALVASLLQSQIWDGYDATYNSWVSGRTRRTYWHQRDEPWAMAFWGSLTPGQKGLMLEFSVPATSLTPGQLWLFERASSWSSSAVAAQDFDATDAILSYGSELRMAARLSEIVRYTAETSKYLKVFGDDMPMRLLGVYLRQARNASKGLSREALLHDVIVTRTTFPGLDIMLFRDQSLLQRIELKRDLDGIEQRGVRLSDLRPGELAELGRLLDQVFPPLPEERP